MWRTLLRSSHDRKLLRLLRAIRLFLGSRNWARIPLIWSFLRKLPTFADHSWNSNYLDWKRDGIHKITKKKIAIMNDTRDAGELQERSCWRCTGNSGSQVHVTESRTDTCKTIPWDASRLMITNVELYNERISRRYAWYAAFRYKLMNSLTILQDNKDRLQMFDNHVLFYLTTYEGLRSQSVWIISFIVEIFSRWNSFNHTII